MIAASLLCLLLSPSAAASPVTVGTLLPADDVKSAIEAAGEDIVKLMELAVSYAEASNTRAAEKVYRRIIQLDPDHAEARAGLRHQFYDGKWFESFVSLAKYKRKEAARMKKKGLGLYKDEWVPLEDLPRLYLGWEKQADGTWVDPRKVSRDQEIAEWKKAGYVFRSDDNSWIAPDEKQKWTELLWKCGDEWLDLEKANEYHSNLETCWEVKGEHFLALTNSDWETGNLARWHADRIYPYMLKIFGMEPKEAPFFMVLPSLSAYNAAAGGGAMLPDSEGFSSLHGAYYGDACFDHGTDPPRYIGMGVCYWDRSDEDLDAWGRCWARWAAAQSYIDAIDPSWTAVGNWLGQESSGQPDQFSEEFWSEKRIPRWLRYGAASYVERFLPDPEAKEGEDIWKLRKFAFEELDESGGMRNLKKVFTFKLSLDDQDGSSRLYHEAGLVVAYLLDGAEGEKKLLEAHEEFKQALSSGTAKELTSAIKSLEKQLLKKKKDIEAFAKL